MPNGRCQPPRKNVVASSESTNFDHSPLPGEWKLTEGADYFHVCSNETVHGHRLPEWPSHPNLIVDSSSEMMSRPHPVSRTALVYAGAQKNLGPSGTVLVIVRKDLYDRIPKSVPKIFNFKVLAEAKSCLNTPPTFGVYMLLETFRWMEKQGGLAAIEKRMMEIARDRNLWVVSDEAYEDVVFEGEHVSPASLPDA